MEAQFFRVSGLRAATIFSALVLASFLAHAFSEDPAGHKDGPPCPAWMSSELTRLEPLVNGSAWDPDGAVLYPRGAYWEEGAANSSDPPEVVTYHVCPCMSSIRPCLRKCCPADQAMNHTTLKCMPHAATRPWFRPPVRDADDADLKAVDGEKHFFIFHGADECEESGRILLEEDFVIRAADGYLVSQNGTETDDPGSFCVDYFVGEDAYLPMVCDSEEAEAANATGSPSGGTWADTCSDIMYVIYPLGMTISVVFLSLSLFVHAYVREMRNLHGKCLMCHISSLLTAYVFLILVQVFGNYMDDNFCIFSGFVVYFSFLSTFLWLNIMCIDMSIAFSGLRMMAGSAQERDRKKLAMYAGYAWGLPVVILVIALVMEFGPVPDYVLKPEFRRTCWFDSDSSRVAYFIAPVGVIIACNIFLFVLTAVKIYTLKKETKVLKKGDSRRHHEGDDKNQRFKLYLKLFIVMGVNWALEIISWIIGGDCIWVPTDFLNTIQGLFVFFIFVWKDRIRRKLVKSLCPRLGTKLKFLMPATINSERRPSASTGSSTMANSTMEESRIRMSTVSHKVAEVQKSTTPSDMTTVT